MIAQVLFALKGLRGFSAIGTPRRLPLHSPFTGCPRAIQRLDVDDAVLIGSVQAIDAKLSRGGTLVYRILLAFLAVYSLDAQPSRSCDRTCLNSFVDRYLEALVAHEPSRLPLARGIKFTENGQQLELGDGLWKTISARGAYSLYADDPHTGQVGFFGTIQENGTPAILAVRLKVEGGVISEIETLVARGDSGGAQGERGARELEKAAGPNPVFLSAVPPGQRATREDLIRTANKYFSGLERNDGKGDYPFTDDCNRIENGVPGTNHPSPDPPRFDISALGCKAQFESGFFSFVTRIRDRRFVVVDEERGLVLAFVFFDHAGTGHPRPGPGGTMMSGGPKRPFTWEIAELFKLENRKIRQIEAVIEQCPYGMGSGWSRREDALSSRIQQ